MRLDCNVKTLGSIKLACNSACCFYHRDANPTCLGHLSKLTSLDEMADHRYNHTIACVPSVFEAP